MTLSLQTVTLALPISSHKYDDFLEYYNDPDFLSILIKADDVTMDSVTDIITFNNPDTLPSQKTDTNTYIIDQDTFIPNEVQGDIGEFVNGKTEWISFLIYILDFWEINGNEDKEIHVVAIQNFPTDVVNYQNEDGSPPNIFSLNVIEYFDGAGGNEYVTRGQMTYYICGLLGLRNYADNYQGVPSIFSDVDESHEMSKYILLAQDAGIISADSAFYPDTPVTYEQVLKMILCALGYEPLAMSSGGYPLGYSTVAEQKGITKRPRVRRVGEIDFIPKLPLVQNWT